MANAQIRCGQLIPNESGKGDVRFSGPVRLIDRLTGELQLQAHPRYDGTNSDTPRYEVFYKPANSDNVYSLGACWVMNSRRTGEEFLSMTLDSPKWDGPLSLAAYQPDKGEKGWGIVWSRPRRQNASEDC